MYKGLNGNGKNVIKITYFLNVKGLRSTNWQLQKNHRDVKYSIGNIVNTVVITMCGAKCVLEISGGSLCKVYECLTTILYN